MIIRQATSADYVFIHSLVREAFRTASVSDGTEQDFVLKLRTGAYIPELELVAEEKNCLIGHIMLTDATICNEQTTVQTLLLSPLSVAFGHRRQGVGGLLIRTALERAITLGYPHVVLAGDPVYYKKFGFQRAHLSYDTIPEKYILARELVPGTLNAVHGKICPDFQKVFFAQGDIT